MSNSKKMFGFKVQYKQNDKKNDQAKCITEDAWVIAATSELALERLAGSMPSATVLFKLEKEHEVSTNW